MAGPHGVSRFLTRWGRYHPRLHEVKRLAYGYFAKQPSRPKSSQYLLALTAARVDFNLGFKIKPLHINDSIKQFKNVDRSPGLPYTQQGFKRKDEVDPQRIKQYAHNLKYNVYRRCDTPCTAAVKTMVSPKNKFRLIWVYPAHMTFVEGMFAAPLIRAYTEARGKYGLWINYSHGDMRLLTAKRRKHNLWLGSDWSSFDATVPAWIIRDAFAILREQLDFDHYAEWGTPTDPYTLDRLWDRIIKYFINTPLRFQDGHVVRKRKGVPSGSYFTNLVDSVVNCIVWHYLLGSAMTDNAWYVGDDALIEVKRNIDLAIVAKKAHSVFGMMLNIEKSSYGTHVSFLGYSMGSDGRPKADYNKLVAQLLLPSRPDRSFLDFCSRGRALQLSCFGLGCWEFTTQVQSFLDDFAPDFQPTLHSRDEMMVKLTALDLANWPPLLTVMRRV